MKDFLKFHWPPILIGITYMILFFATAGRYGIFRDELYYIDCARHMAWGYVDQPPFSIVVLWAVLKSLGDSILAIRLVPMLCGLAGIGLTWLLTLRIGGSRFAAGLASLAWFANPTFVILTNFYSMNALDLIFWLTGFLLVVEWIRAGNDRLLLWLGVIAGLGLLNKYSMGFWLLSFSLALLISTYRKTLLRPWIWGAALIALVLFLPHIIWQIQHGWPSLEFMQNAAAYKIARLSPIQILSDLIKTMNPVNVLLWIPGLLALFFWKSLRAFRIIGIMAVVFFVFLLVQTSKVYYFAPIFPILYASGSAWISHFFSGKRRWGRPVLVSFLIFFTLVILPIAMPVLSPDTLADYLHRTGLQPQAQERSRVASLPQYFADRFGWEEMAAAVSKHYQQLPEAVQQDIVVYADNYGEAGAINYYRKRYPLPPAVSGHNSYYFWGPGSISGEHLIVIAGDKEELEEAYENVVLLKRFTAPYIMPYEDNLPIYYCSGLKVNFETLWPTTKHFI